MLKIKPKSQPHTPLKSRFNLKKNKNEIRIEFIKSEEEFNQKDVYDMKKTVEINKELIKSLIKNCKESGLKSAFLRLNEENKLLQNQISFLKSQRDQYHKKNMMAEQIIVDLQQKAKDDYRDYSDFISDLLTQLDKKEYVIQSLRYKYDRLKNIVRKYANTDHELKEFFKEYNEDYQETGKVSTLIETNKLMSEEVTKLNNKIEELQKTISENKSRLKIGHFSIRSNSMMKNSVPKDNALNDTKHNEDTTNDGKHNEDIAQNDKWLRNSIWPTKGNQLYLDCMKGTSGYLDIKTCNSDNNQIPTDDFDGISVIAVKCDDA